MNDIISMNLTELELLMQEMKQGKFRAKQLFDWLHNKMVWNYDEMSNLPATLRNELKEKFPLTSIKILEKYESQIDGTIKYLFELSDSHIIESVLMRYKHGNSICISSQVGCRMGCKFCASTLEGLVRNLKVSEMLGQIYQAQLDTGERISNIVIMGSGEPLEYMDITTKFVELINHELGQNIGQRHITVSTCGLVPKIYELADRGFQITLAISLHATTDEKRREVMPIAKKYSIAEILEACKYYIDQTGRRITFEYSLIQGENDSVEDAMRLAKLLKGMLAHVNLIPVNPIEERGYKAATNHSIEDFADVLKSNHIETTVRRTLGQDIDAACGQLRRRYLQKRGE
ncbi:23S rRNA (adenine(2503)-C(2))-methyltransferase RlmN [Niameybacter massiliensis]|uniref:Probable dual-specificity RNA methyltransferase RlmN n=1 Tax=Holtiella tumoricola TaxID=3018743 RepID=A0AA42DQX5_9FIRM|nr:MULTISPECIES: 23S rRNA (adenine(2503)-C(2))-methyltransferase RlmN [Lachnospirales]MDA3733107.1 23S rRNA (adenine(2503)-C(2))-methyltransferase RlmN [Holtiella tumoricola]